VNNAWGGYQFPTIHIGSALALDLWDIPNMDICFMVKRKIKHSFSHTFFSSSLLSFLSCSSYCIVRFPLGLSDDGSSWTNINHCSNNIDNIHCMMAKIYCTSFCISSCSLLFSTCNLVIFNWRCSLLSASYMITGVHYTICNTRSTFLRSFFSLSLSLDNFWNCLIGTVGSS